MTTPLKEKLKKDLISLSNDVSTLWMHHDLFWRMTEITNKNERVMKVGGDYLAWLKNAYIEAGSVAFRRQIDRDKRSVSMVNFLLEVQKNCASFTREDFQKTKNFSPDSHFHNAQKWGEFGTTFDQTFGNGGHLDPAIVQADIDLLETEGAAIKEQVNKEIAYKDKGGMKGDKPTGEVLEKCIGNLDAIASKYSLLLYGEPFKSLRLQYLFDVEEVFTFAWKDA
jgi:hypothetical protein